MEIKSSNSARINMNICGAENDKKHMSKKGNKVIGIIMTYNCADMLEDTFGRIPLDLFDEIFVTDDGSRDNTVERAESLGIPVYRHENFGYGGNIKYGLQKALDRGGEIIIEIHGDGQYDPAVTAQALDKIGHGCDLVLGSRFINILQPLKDQMPLIRFLANIGLSALDRLILGVPLTEFHTGYRVYTKKFIENLDLNKMSNDYLFSFEIIVQACFDRIKIGEVPIRCNYAGVHSSINIWNSSIYSFQTFGLLIGYLLLKRGISTPLFRSARLK